jgi:GT2 family glycosyltransferase
MRNQRIDVVIPTYNNREELRSCLDSLAASRHPVRALVCVDGSSDGTIEYLHDATFEFPVVVLEHPDRRHHALAATRNLSLGALDSEFLLHLDSDMTIEPQTIDRHLDLLTQKPCVSVGERVYLNARTHLWARYLGTRGKNKSASGAEISPMYLTTANVALPTAAFVEVGGFDSRMTAYGGDDTDLGIRLAERGLPVYFNGKARAFTFEPRTVERGLALYREFARHNIPLILEKHPNGPVPYWVDRYASPRIQDRLLRLGLNPVSDALISALLPITPFAIQRHLLNYKVLRAVFDGYGEWLREDGPGRDPSGTGSTPRGQP